MDYSCCFSFGGNLDFLDFLQKKFYNINYWGDLRGILIGCSSGLNLAADLGPVLALFLKGLGDNFLAKVAQLFVIFWAI